MYASGAYCLNFCSNSLFAVTKIAVCKCSLRVMLYVSEPVLYPAHRITSVHCVFYLNFRLVRPFNFVFVGLHIDGLIPNQLLKVIIPFTYTSQILCWVTRSH
jgi:hypothetical protein